MKILSFGGSTSSSSINRQLANHAAGLVPSAEITPLDLRQFDLPIYSSDEEDANGVPGAAQEFKQLIDSHDAIVVSLAEHNGSYSAAFKNLYDWTSRIDTKVWSDKPMLLMATSPGGRGGATVLEAAKATFPRMGADLKATFSLPAFYENFSAEEGVTNPEFKTALDEAIAALSA